METREQHKTQVEEPHVKQSDDDPVEAATQPPKPNKYARSKPLTVITPVSDIDNEACVIQPKVRKPRANQ